MDRWGRFGLVSTISLVSSFAGACAGGAIDDRPAIASEVVAAPGATGEGFRDVSRAVDGVRGAGEREQSLNVFSLGLREGEDDYLVLGFGGRRLIDGPGADLAVFENPFVHPGGVFVDPIVVAVSADGERWAELPHDYRGSQERASYDPADWQGFAGRTPVLLNEDTHPVDPFDAALAGGDAFDLADLGNDPASEAVRSEGARYVRLTAAATQIDPDTGARYPLDPISDGPDIDGVYGRWLIAGSP